MATRRRARTEPAPTDRDFIPPRVDLLVRLLLVRRPRLLRSMLEAVLEPEQPFQSLQILDADLPPETIVSKSVVLDVRTVLGDGRKASIEIQNVVSVDLAARVLFYWARNYVSDLARGQGYDPLRQTLVIVWTAQPMLPDERRFHSIFEVRERERGTPFTDHLRIHLLELPHLSLDPPPGRALALWSRFLAAHTQAELDQLAAEDTIMAEARDAHQELTTDPRQQSLLRTRQRMLEEAEIARATELDMVRRTAQQRGLEQGLDQGLKQGLDQGLKQGLDQGLKQGLDQGLARQRDMVRRLLERRFGPLDAASALRVGAASADQLLHWAERLLDAPTLEAVLADP